jgi:hypothetical protein
MSCGGGIRGMSGGSEADRQVTDRTGMCLAPSTGRSSPESVTHGALASVAVHSIPIGRRHIRELLA